MPSKSDATHNGEIPNDTKGSKDLHINGNGRKKLATKRNIESSEEEPEEKENTTKSSIKVLIESSAKKSKLITESIISSTKELTKTRRNIRPDTDEQDESDSSGVYTSRFSSQQITRFFEKNGQGSPKSPAIQQKNTFSDDGCIILD